MLPLRRGRTLEDVAQVRLTRVAGVGSMIGMESVWPTINLVSIAWI